MNYYKILLLTLIIFSNLFGKPNEQVSLQLLWKHQFEFAGFYMAKEKGFYNDVGLDVEFKEYQQGTNIVSDVEQGKSTYGIGYPSIILDKTNGAKINILSAILQSSPHTLVSLQSSGINSIKDFKDKRIMINSNAIKDASLLAMLKTNNISIEQDMKPLEYNFKINDLIDGKTDISTCFLSNEIYILEKRNIAYKIWDPKDYGFEFYDDLLFTSTNELENNNKRVEAFRSASLRGWQYAFEHIDETVAIILEKYNTQNKTKSALEYEAKVLKKLAFYKTNEIGHIDNFKIQRIIDIYNIMGLIHNQIDIDEFIYQEKTNTVNLTQKEKEWIKNNTIKVGISPWYPITYYDKNTNKTSGIGFDIINEVAKNLNLKVKYVPNRWNTLLEQFKNNTIDLLPTTFYTNERASFGYFSKPYLDVKEQLFVKKDRDINGFKDLKDSKIAIVKAYGAISKIKEKYPTIQIIQTDTLKESIELVLTNQADAVFNNQFNISSFLKDNFIYNLKPIYQTDFKPSPLHFFINQDNLILQQILEKGLESISYEEKNKILSKWIDTKEDKVKTQDKKLDFLTQKQREYLKDKKQITMCIDPAWMPFESFKNGQHIGMTADYFKIFTEEFKLPIKVIKTTNWPQSIEYAKNKKCDILSLVMKTPERTKYLNFTTPYLKIPLVLATKNDVPFVSDFKTLTDEKIGIPKGYAFVELLKTKYPNINIIEVKNLKDGLEQVNEGKLFGYIGTLASVGYMFQTQFTGELKIARKFDETWELGIGVRNDDPTLLNILESGVKNIQEETHRTILNKWIAIKYEKKVDYTLLWQVLFVILVLIAFIIYRQLILKNLNKSLQIAVDEKTKELKELNENLELKIEQAIEESAQKDRILYTQSKMASMGEMIANISHQWRQPLSIISTVASGMKLKIEHDIFNKDEEVKNLDILIDSTHYLSSTIDDFKNFLNPEKTTKVFNINDVITKTIAMFGKSFTSHGINIISNTRDINIIGNENELLQVIINIINNSKDVLTPLKIDEKFIIIDIDTTDENIILTIKDNGGGIQSDILPKIFEAYFTTKHKSIGTGIGLYMSYQIIKNSFQGSLVATNENFSHENHDYLGAKFTISLPINSDN
jgi:ABC-type amino acid transport substrate-binding protein/nitrogen-specific signal transduction histidine kinase